VPDVPPIALTTLSATEGAAPLTVTVDASSSSDTDQTPIAQIFVNFGDGTTVLASGDRTATHTYDTAGDYTVILVVIDTARNSASASADVVVR
jgi:PKD repeat protein